MDNYKKAKYLQDNEFTIEEICVELGFDDVETVRKLVKKKGYKRCDVCLGYFDHMKPYQWWCGFSCWASRQPSGTWAELKEQYAKLST